MGFLIYLMAAVAHFYCFSHINRDFPPCEQLSNQILFMLAIAFPLVWLVGGGVVIYEEFQKERK